MSKLSTILAAIDYSSGSLAALTRARSLAATTGASLIACMVLEGAPDTQAEEDIRQRLAEVAPDCELQIRWGSPFLELIHAARDADAGLIVAGATGEHTEGQLALGVTVDRLARKADRPVLVVRKPAQDGYRSVIVGVDGSSDATQAALLARRLASQARLTAVMAAEPIGEHLLTMRGTPEEGLDAYRKRLEEDARKRIEAIAASLPVDSHEVRAGRPEQVLQRAVERHDAEMVAVGRRGLSPLATVLLGSVGHHLVHEAPCDVLVYRSTDLDFEMP
jgi:nucleotide-binding universal stress UspA family protein